MPFCAGHNKDGKKCKNVVHDSKYCWRHKDQSDSEDLPQADFQNLDIKALVSLGHNICSNLVELTDTNTLSSFSPRDQAIITHITKTLGIDDPDLTNTEKCKRITEKYKTLVEDIRKVSNIEKRSRYSFPTLSKLLFLTLTGIALVTASSYTCVKTAAETRQCKLELLVENTIPSSQSPSSIRIFENNVYNPFEKARLLVTGDDIAISTEIEHLVSDKLFIQNVYNSLVDKRIQGISETPTATFILGGSGSGKSLQFEKLLKNNDLNNGIKGSIVLNTDDLMEFIPGYKESLDLGYMNSLPISLKDAASIYHEGAEDMNKALMGMAIQKKQSFIFDGTGNTLSSLKSKIETLKTNGFNVNIIAVTAPVEIRKQRVKNRAVISGRYVAPEIVERGRSKDEWLDIIRNYLQGMVNYYAVVENN